RKDHTQPDPAHTECPKWYCACSGSYYNYTSCTCPGGLSDISGG
ncbi:9757_t:CDS:2, partial [Dentiscutata erythropus]